MANRKNDNDWESVRGRAWARWVRTTAEQILNGDAGLSPRLADPKVREHLDRELVKANAERQDASGSDKPVLDDAVTVHKKKAASAAPAPVEPKRRVLSGRQMDRLVGRRGNGWSRWEAGTIVPGGTKADDEERAVGDTTLATAFWTVADHVVPGAERFWTVGPCHDDEDLPLPLWAMLRGDTSRDGLWHPVLCYREGRSDDHQSVAEVCELDGVAFHPEAGKARSDDLKHGLRAWLNPDLAPKDQPASLLDRNELYHADQLARFTGEAFMRAMRLGARTVNTVDPDQFGRDVPVAPEPEPGFLAVHEALVLAVATSFTKGERQGIEWRENHFEERLFHLLRVVRPRILAYAARFGVEAGVRRWLRRMHSDYLDRNGYGRTPLPSDVVGQDPELVAITPARPGRPMGKARYSARTRHISV